jgi:hypothetical protein
MVVNVFIRAGRLSQCDYTPVIATGSQTSHKTHKKNLATKRHIRHINKNTQSVKVEE